jgi:predicted CoA-binding protein
METPDNRGLVPAGISALKPAFIAEKSLAVVGVSAGRGFANLALGELRKRGYRVFPVSRTAEAVAGERCYRSLAELPEPVGGVVVVVRPEAVPPVLEECVGLGIVFRECPAALQAYSCLSVAPPR